MSIAVRDAEASAHLPNLLVTLFSFAPCFGAFRKWESLHVGVPFSSNGRGICTAVPRSLLLFAASLMLLGPRRLHALYRYPSRSLH